jgi:2',3'-cyclic-nucleotide 2'-phosphodiesterase (5'-nucleotidase family)
MTKRYLSRLTFSFALFLALISCEQKEKGTWFKSDSYTAYIPVDSVSAIHTNEEVDAFIAPYREKVNEQMNRVIGQTNKEIFKNRPNGTLNNLAADMVLEITKQKLSDDELIPDMCLLNYGGLRYPLPKGKITIANIFQLMPFQNEAVILKLSGAQMDSLFRFIATSNGQPLAGAVVKVKESEFVNASIASEAFDPNKSYNVLTSDYLAGGGDKMTFLKHPLETQKTGLLIRNLMIEYCEQITAQGGLIEASNELRIQESE